MSLCRHVTSRGCHAWYMHTKLSINTGIGAFILGIVYSQSYRFLSEVLCIQSVGVSTTNAQNVLQNTCPVWLGTHSMCVVGDVGPNKHLSIFCVCDWRRNMLNKTSHAIEMGPQMHVAESRDTFLSAQRLCDDARPTSGEHAEHVLSTRVLAKTPVLAWQNPMSSQDVVSLQ